MQPARLGVSDHQKGWGCAIISRGLKWNLLSLLQSQMGAFDSLLGAFMVGTLINIALFGVNVSGARVGPSRP